VGVEKFSQQAAKVEENQLSGKFIFGLFLIKLQSA